MRLAKTRGRKEQPHPRDRQDEIYEIVTTHGIGMHADVAGRRLRLGGHQICTCLLILLGRIAGGRLGPADW